MSDETKAAPGETPAPPATPELDRQHQAIEDGAHRIGEFLDWLGEQGYYLTKYGDNGPYAAGPGPGELIASFYKIDLGKIEQERQALLDYLREMNS
jgi:hypothetical protein